MATIKLPDEVVQSSDDLTNQTPHDAQFSMAEKTLVRKIDLRLIPWLAILYLLLSLDRNNIGNARLGSLEQDLHLQGDQYYSAVLIFFAGYVIFHIPSNLMIKRVRPSRWISGTMVLWGLSSLGQAATYNAAGLFACRFWLGAFETGVGPYIPLYLSFWYRREELALRVAMYFGSSTVAGAFAGAIAYGVLGNLDGALGIAGWRWLFIVEAVPTVFLGALSLWVLPDLPETATKWLTPEDRQVAMLRTQLSGNTDNKIFDMGQFISALVDYKVWLSVVIYVGLNVSLASYAVYLPTIIRDMGFQALDAQLLSIPPYVVASCLVFLVSWNSDRTLQRAYHIMAVSTLGVMGYIFLLTSLNVGLRYTGAILVACGIYPIIPLTLSWVSNNQLGHTKRAVAIAMTSMVAQCFSMLGTQIYKSEDGPRYIRGHTICLVFLSLSGIAAAVLRFLLWRENIKKDRIHGIPERDEMSKIGDTGGLYERHPLFRFAL